MLVRSSEHKGGTGLSWACGKMSYFSKESLVLMSQELSSWRAMGCSDPQRMITQIPLLQGIGLVASFL